MMSTPGAASAPMPLVPALALVVVGGLVLDGAFPDLGWWPLAFPGVAASLVAFRGRSVRGALLVGFVGGLGFYLPLIPWAREFLYGNPVPWIALSVAEALFWSAGAALVMLAYRWLPRAWPGTVGRLAVLPIAVAGLWTLREACAAVWPYGGFAWGRLAQSQTEGPFRELFPWLGVSGVTFVLVWITALAVECLALAHGRAISAPRALPGRLARATAVTALVTAAVAVPLFPVVTDGTLRVAAVQGNAAAAYTDVRDRGDNLADQFSATAPLWEDDLDLDVVLWPEGGSDLDPTGADGDPQGAAVAERAFDAVVDRTGAPLIAGAITAQGETIHNSLLLWEQDAGATDRYDKVHPVPFGEYVPDREFWEPFAPDLIGLIAREYTPGTRDAVMTLPSGVTVGVDICYDIVDDGLLRQSVVDGAQVLFSQSNNADFGRTDQSEQQLAIARTRALESGRTVVNVSTVGITAVLEPDGSTVAQLPWYTRGALVHDAALSTTITPAVAAGRTIEWAIGAVGLVLLAGAALELRGRRRA
jgi:apolipoprotein N-acyltransferase